MKIEQISVFVENQPGRLVAILEVLEKKQISIRALSISDATEFGIVRMILSNAEEGLEALRQAGFITRMDLLLGVEIADVPGGILKSVAKPLAEAKINLEYFYAYIELSTDKAMVVLKADDLERAEKALES